MGNFERKNRRGTSKKVANVGNFAKQVIINGELPPTPKDESEREFLLGRGVAILGDDFEKELFNIFLKVVKHDEMGFLTLEYDLVKEYAKMHEYELIELNEMLNVVCEKANATLSQRAEK